MTGCHHTVARAGAVAAALVWCASCSSEGSCEKAAPEASSCADLRFDGTSYDEWRPFRGPSVLQELGDGTYPGCNSTDACDSEGVGDHGATDVWRLEGVDPARALVGLREDSRTRVIFVKVGVDPNTISRDTISPDSVGPAAG
jgi:hypothetical protein